MKKDFWKSLIWGKTAKPFAAWQIELTTRCPLRCKMCCREGHHDMARKDMSLEDFGKILPYLRDVENVVLEGWGESLLHPRLVDIIRLVKKEGARVGFVTSGLTLTENYIADLVGAGTDFIGFSLSGAAPQTHDSIRVNSRLPDLLGHIRKIQEIKAARKTLSPQLHIVYCLLKNNIAELPPLIRIARDLGIEEVALIHMAFISNEWQESQRIFARDDTAEFEEQLSQAEALARDMKISLTRPSLVPRDVAVCSENPLRNLYVSVSGNVSPCVYLRPPLPPPFRRIFHGSEVLVEKVGFGNIFQTPFEEIWTSPAYEAFRAMFTRREEKMREMTEGLWDPDKRKNTPSSLPEPPLPCRSCYKVEGF
ncbi:MAG TPA: radical SAM protein [Thermodesulfobacteriota bacterium]|nr:radical SAM protein [Thermodesulfobacteriota bacterium]